MTESERREFEAGLSEEVDGWLRGDRSRRTLLTRMMLMGGAAMLPGLGWTASGNRAWAQSANLSKVELADPSHPARRGAGGGGAGLDRGPADGSAYRAVQAAQAVQGQECHAEPDLRVGAAGARAEEFFRPAVAGADRHQFQRGRAAASRSVLEADRRAHRQFRRIRRPRYRAGVDTRPGQWRRHRGDRRLRRQVHEQGGPRGLPPAVQGHRPL